MKRLASKALLVFCACESAFAGVVFPRAFAPEEGWIKPVEQPFRQELCLNGLWQFQPMPTPRDWKRDTGKPPELAEPVADKWEPTLIKIPSPWNVNGWGAGRNVGAGTPHPYWPSSVYYTSYPSHWDGVEMGWLRRTFRVPAAWGDRRIVLHFEAVGGDAQVFVNGRKAGGHFDRFLPFELDVTALVKRDADNELLVGVRSMRLFDQRSEKYKLMRTPYPPGSNTDNLTGIWQDVFLLGLPPVRVADVFVKPWVDRDTLEAEILLRNNSSSEHTVEVSGTVQPWVNLAGTNVLDAPEPKWRLDTPAMSLPAQRVTLKPGETKVITLAEKVAGRLKFWSTDAPNLNGLVLSVDAAGQPVDRSFTRFGWRQCKIVGKEFQLNGRKMTMFGDLLHPFGPFVNSRRYVWAWYRMIKDMHGNAVRPHAQPHPRHYLDLADEMGLLVLDETAMFGSSLQLNFEAPVAWERYAEHYDNLIRRDRNHPSVFGWSWGNELFAIFIYDKAITKEQTDAWYQQIAALGARGRRLDPTRDWVSCDGDEDMRGTMPVWNKHFGHGLPHPDWLPKEQTKPWMVGESGGSYYARPAQLAVFNGDRAFESYAGRNEALAIDVYDNIVNLARPKLAFYSPAETAWFGIEHLPIGYRDFTRLPGTNDGVWLPPFEEGRPGMQPERIPPYVCTLNPGWDASLPLYKPLAMFEAQKAAQVPGAPQPCAWSRKPEIKPSVTATVPATIESVGFLGACDGELFKRLTTLGLPMDHGEAKTSKLLIVEAATLSQASLAQRTIDATLASKGTVLVMFRQAGEVPAVVNQLLPAPVTLTSRHATALAPRLSHSWTAGLGLTNLYFAEDAADKQVTKCGLAGPLVEQGRVLLEASATDWSLFNGAPENAKCAAVLLHERIIHPSGVALVTLPLRGGTLAVSSLDYLADLPAHTALWRRLFANMGVRINQQADAGNSTPAAKKQHDLLLDGPVGNRP